jgi:5-methylcytosine-specific restriction endonuclease McrA
MGCGGGISLGCSMSFTRTFSEEYTDYIKSREWRGKRKLLLNFADHRCQLCGSDITPLHIHHRDYARLQDEHLSDLMVLCQRCHGLADFLRKRPWNGTDPDVVNDELYWAILEDQRLSEKHA